MPPKRNTTPEPSTNGHAEEPLFNGMDPIQFNRFMSLVQNEMMASRTELRNLLFDDRRDIENECGHPAYGALIDVWQLRMLYDRVPEAAKVVELGPKWTWSGAPTIEEDADTETETEFEGAVKEFAAALQPEPSLMQTTDECSPLWPWMRQLDILAGIGGYGVMLLGFDDGRPLHEPVLPSQDTPLTTVERDALMSPAPLTFPSMFGGTYGMSIPGMSGLDGSAMGGSMAITYEQNQALKNGIIKVNSTPISTQRPNPFYPSEAEVIEQWYRESEPYREAIRAVERGEQVTLNESVIPKRGVAAPPKKLLWVNSFSEELCQIVRWDWNMASPRFGLPIMYRITLNDPRGGYSGIGLPFTTIFVHWSRVIHLFDQFENVSSAKFAAPPRIRPVLNEILNIRKIRGASAEGLWKAAFTKLFFETHPQLGGDVRVNEMQMKRMMENMGNSQQMYGWLAGMHANPIAPQVSDPTPHLQGNIAAICAKMDIPKRIWEGSERGELSSTEDTGSWEGRVRARRQIYATPKIIGPFFDRMIAVGLLPRPKQFWANWPDIAKQSDQEIAQVGLIRTQAMGAFVAQGIEQICDLKNFYSKIMGIKDKDAEAIVKEAQSQAEEDMMTMDPTEEEAPQPMKLGPGESMHDPETGDEMGRNPHPPQAPQIAGGGPVPVPSKGAKGDGQDTAEE